MPTRSALLGAALALAIAAQPGVAQEASGATTTAAPEETAIVVPERAPPGASAQIGMGALIGLLAGIVVVSAMVSGM